MGEGGKRRGEKMGKEERRRRRGKGQEEKRGVERER